MKKIIIILTLMLVMAMSVTAGTLAMYTTSIDSMAQGSVTAKEFVFTGDGTDSFAQGVKIAPGETVTWQFGVRNFEGYVITETDLYYRLTFRVKASEGKNAIAPLTVTVTDNDGAVVGRAIGAGTFDVLGAFPLSENGQSRSYTVALHWPGDGNADIDYAGGQFGTTVTVDALASQVPLDGGETQPPSTGDMVVAYRTTQSWQNGQDGIDRFNYSVTITNNSNAVIKDWFIEFTLANDTLAGVFSNAKMVGGLPSGTYRFNSPMYNNTQTDDLNPGESVTFSGHALGKGTTAPQNVRVGGRDMAPESVSVTTGFGSLG